MWQSETSYMIVMSIWKKEIIWYLKEWLKFMYMSGIMEMWLHHIIFLLLKSKKIILFLFRPSLHVTWL